MTTAASQAVVDVARHAGEVVVSVLGEPSHRTVSVLSCRLHEASRSPRTTWC